MPAAKTSPRYDCNDRRGSASSGYFWVTNFFQADPGLWWRSFAIDRERGDMRISEIFALGGGCGHGDDHCLSGCGGCGGCGCGGCGRGAALASATTTALAVVASAASPIATTASGAVAPPAVEDSKGSPISSGSSSGTRVRVVVPSWSHHRGPQLLTAPRTYPAPPCTVPRPA